QSIEKRKNLISKADAFRLISSEADGLPTLIVDKYRDYLVMQTLGVATEMRKNLFADILCQILKPKGIYERNDVPIRKLEGLSSNKGLLMGKIPELITITENRIRFFVDIKNGQKTGFYIDQRDNRNIVRDFSKEAKVLDCFCYTGGFSIYALYYGANHVTGIDISEESIKLAKRNAALNNFKDKKFIFNIANVFDELKNFDRCGEKFDLVVLDPPSFTRKKQTLKAAIRGYKEINLRAMKILKPGGVLITCSCSYHIGLELFKSMLIQASSDAKRTVRILDIRNHPMDHPILLQLKESSYLKCLVLEIV
ncbi:MAG: class I SAM-dependent rRNA methyltransferase, partial [Candidatus Omnitrophica bacterium]|nr:class I SAM-dependent rRNA methyltransferase [Candidatus Omnitrophota bacterium]